MKQLKAKVGRQGRKKGRRGGCALLARRHASSASICISEVWPPTHPFPGLQLDKTEALGRALTEENERLRAVIISNRNQVGRWMGFVRATLDLASALVTRSRLVLGRPRRPTWAPPPAEQNEIGSDAMCVAASPSLRPQADEVVELKAGRGRVVSAG